MAIRALELHPKLAQARKSPDFRKAKQAAIAVDRTGFYGDAAKAKVVRVYTRSEESVMKQRVFRAYVYALCAFLIVCPNICLRYLYESIFVRVKPGERYFKTQRFHFTRVPHFFEIEFRALCK